MLLRSVAYLLPCLGSSVVLAVSAISVEVCETSPHEPLDIRRIALMQRKKESRVVAPVERNAGPGAVRLFLSEMESLAHRKGIDGLDPEEVQHIQTIKGLIADTIIPSILDDAEQDRQEIAELYEAVLNCTHEATDDLEVESTIHIQVEQHRDDHKECRKLEDDIIKEKNHVCHQFNITRTSIELPSGEMPGLEADDATMIQYLKDMNEYFCGRMQAFKDEWNECEELTKNYTDINDQCVTLQQDLEESWCTWMSELEGTCGGMSECWQSTVTRFNERKIVIEQLVEERREALKGALKAECLWDAWEWDREPCTVNETKIKECNGLMPNTTAIEVDIPSTPQRHPCNMSADGLFPCNEAFIGSVYASLDVSQALIDEIRDACSACPPPPVLAASAPSQHDAELQNMEHLEGTIYTTTSNEDGTRSTENVRGDAPQEKSEGTIYTTTPSEDATRHTENVRGDLQGSIYTTTLIEDGTRPTENVRGEPTIYTTTPSEDATRYTENVRDELQGPIYTTTPSEDAELSQRDVELKNMARVEGTIYTTTPRKDAEIRMENVRGMTFSLDNVVQRFILVLYDGIGLIVGVHVLGRVLTVILYGFSPVLKKQWPVQVDDVVSFACSGEKFKFYLKGDLVFEAPLPMPSSGFLARSVTSPAPRNRPRRVDVAFDTLAVDAGVPHLYGLERVGASSYKATGIPEVSGHRGGALMAQDVLAVTISTNDDFKMWCRAGGFHDILLTHHRFGSRNNGKVVMQVVPISEEVHEEEFDFKDSDLFTLEVSGAEMSLKQNGIVKASMLNLAPSTGFRTVYVELPNADQQADVALVFASGAVRA